MSYCDAQVGGWVGGLIDQGLEFFCGDEHLAHSLVTAGIGGWVGGWVGWMEEEEAVRMSYCDAQVGGWVGGLIDQGLEFFCGDEHLAHSLVTAEIGGWVGGWVGGLDGGGGGGSNELL